jgi:O-antigen ligase
VLSLSRAGILTLVLVLAVLLLVAWRKPQLRRMGVPAVVSAGVLMSGVAILTARSPVFDLRLVSESDADWYGAAYSAPASLRLEADQLVSIALDVRNEGRIVWSSSGNRPFALGYRWLTVDGAGVLDVPPGEVPLTHDVAPEETIHLQVLVQVPPLPPGAYRLDWGMLQRDVLQFYERGWADAQTVVTVAQPAGEAAPAMLAILPRDDGEAPWVVGRLDLWGAALRLIQTRPLLGVGPDNFRHLYGAQLGLESWDERVQANNLYLEVLADVGLLGLAAFLWVVGAPLITAKRLLTARFARSSSTDNELSERDDFDTRQGAAQRRWAGGDPRGEARIAMVLGLTMGVGAFLVHGLLDSFLAFTPTALLLWMLLGLLLAQKPQVSGR